MSTLTVSRLIAILSELPMDATIELAEHVGDTEPEINQVSAVFHDTASDGLIPDNGAIIICPHMPHYPNNRTDVLLWSCDAD